MSGSGRTASNHDQHVNAHIPALEYEKALKANIIDNMTALWASRYSINIFRVVVCAKVSPHNNVVTCYQAKCIGYLNNADNNMSWRCVNESMANHPRVYLALEDLLASSQYDVGLATADVPVYQEFRG